MQICQMLLCVFACIVVWTSGWCTAGEVNLEKDHLQSIIIHLQSSRQLKQLRKYPVEIVRVRQDRASAASPASLDKPQIVEAVASPSTISMLKKSGFDVSIVPGSRLDMPPKEKFE